MRAQMEESLGERYVEPCGEFMQLQLTEIRDRGIWRPGSDPLGHRDGQGGVHLRRRLCHHDAEFRAGSAGRRLQRAASDLSDDPMLYPYVTQPDIMVVMSQEAYSRFAPELKDGGTLIVEQDLVRVSDLPRQTKVYSVQPPASPKNLASAWC